MCGVSQPSPLARIVACSAVLKAGKVGEFVSIAAAELAFKRTLRRVHAAAVDEVVVALHKVKPLAAEAKEFSDVAKQVYEEVYVVEANDIAGEHVDKVYRLMKRAMVRRLNGKIKGEFVYDHKVEKAEVPAPPTIDLVFGVVDERAIRNLASGFFFWFAENYEANVSEAIKAVVAAEGLRAGERWVDVADRLETTLRRELGVTGAGRKLQVPSGWRGTYEEYFEALAASVTTTARVASSIRAMEEFEAPHIVIVNPEDEKTCPRCWTMSGKQFPLSAAVAQLKKLYAARSRKDVIAAQPWYSEKEFLKISDKPGHVSDQDSARLAEAGVVLPTYHFRCRCTVDLAPGHEIE